MRSHFSLDIIIEVYIITTVLCCITVLYLINYVPQPKETKGYMRSHFSLDIIIEVYIITTVLYCTVLYCTLLIMYHNPRRQRVICVQIFL